MSGGGIGSALGGAGALGLGALLAPETMGASLAIPAALGAAGGALGGGVGSAATGGGNPWGAALGGGITGMLGGVMNGLLSPAADAGSQAANDAVQSTENSGGTSGGFLSNLFGSGSSSPAQQVASDVASEAPSVTPTGSSGLDSLLNGFAGDQAQSTAPIVGGGNISGAAQGAASSGLLSKSNLPYLGLGLSALGALMPSGSNPVNTSNLNSMSSGFNASLPKYNYNSVKTPYVGDWYTYGQRPQTPMVQNTITPAARGGLMKYAQGGQVDHPTPQHKPVVPPLRTLSVDDVAAALPQGVIPQQPLTPDQQRLKDMQQDANFFDNYKRGGPVKLAMGGMPPNPQQAMQFKLGQKIGQSLRNHIKGQGMTPNGVVQGVGKGQDDAIPARLSQGEYVVPSEVVSQLGDGSSNAGGQALDKMVSHVRGHKTSHGKKFPPKAKNPLDYIRGAK